MNKTDTGKLENLKERVGECKRCSDVGFCWNIISMDEIIDAINELIERQTKE